MKIITILLFNFFIFTTILNAKNSYIQVTTTKSKSKLKTITKKFKSMGIKTVYKKTKTKYLIYSGPYKNQDSASDALEKIQKYYPKAQIKGHTKLSNPQKDWGTYFNLSLGFSHSPSTQTNGCVVINEPKNSGISYNVNGGYVFKSNFAFEVGYLRFDASDLLFDNVYSAVSYRFNDYRLGTDNDYVAYIGFMAGYSSLKWFHSPIPPPPDEDSSHNNSTSYLFGTKTGLIYNMFDSFSMFVGYQCLFMSHTTNLTDTDGKKSKLEHNTLHTLQLGVEF